MSGKRIDRKWLLVGALLLASLVGWLLFSGDSQADRSPGRKTASPHDPDPAVLAVPVPDPADGDRRESTSGPTPLPELCPPSRLEGRWQIVSIEPSQEDPSGRTRTRLALVEFDLTNGVMIVDGRNRIPIGFLSDGSLNIDTFHGQSATLRPTLEGDRLVLTAVDWRSEDEKPTPKRIVLRQMEDEATDGLDPGEQATRYYQGVIRRSFSPPGGGRVAFPIDADLGLRLRKKLPPGLEAPLTFLTAHLFVLDRAEDFQVRQLARIALATHEEAVSLLLERRSWRDLGLRGKWEVAALLSIPGAATVARLAASIGDPADPVVLMALMEHTQYTFGCPSWCLAEDGLEVPPGIVAHWRRWLAEEWPSREKLVMTERLRAEVADLQRLFDSADPLAVKECAARVSFLMGQRFRPPPEDRPVDRDRLRKHLKLLADSPDFFTGRPAQYSTE